MSTFRQAFVIVPVSSVVTGAATSRVNVIDCVSAVLPASSEMVIVFAPGLTVFVGPKE